MSTNNFDRIADIYDALARLVFADQLHQSEIAFLDQCKPVDNILILGGGNGRILKQLPKDASITYIDLSRRMVDRAKRSATSAIAFDCIDFFDFKADRQYDVVICPFFLDCFKEARLVRALQKIKGLVKPKGLLLVADFEKGSINPFLVKVMHWFFKITTDLEADRLLPINEEVAKHNFELVAEKFFYQKGVFSRVYRNL